METLKTVWRVLDGKKSVIAALAGVALSWAQVRGYLSEDSSLHLATALTVLTGVAVGHKITKTL